MAGDLAMGALLPRAGGCASAISSVSTGCFPILPQRRQQAAGTLSGGEQQMLAVGRCLMGAPDLVMLNEPMSWDLHRRWCRAC